MYYVNWLFRDVSLLRIEAKSERDQKKTMDKLGNTWKSTPWVLSYKPYPWEDQKQEFLHNQTHSTTREKTALLTKTLSALP